MGLLEDLRKLSEKVKLRKDHVKGEEATKHALIVPFLQVIGFDTTDPLEVKPEFVADFAKRRSNGQFQKVDYLITVKGEPAIFVEAKSVEAAAEEHDGQLRYYFNSTPSVKLAIVTNGLVYRFFTDLKMHNIMDEVPFLEFNILQITEREAGIIERYTKARFDAESVRQHAEEVISLEKVTKLINDLLRNPSASFVKLVIEQLDLVGDNRITANVISRFEPIVRKSIENVLFEHVARAIQQMQAPPPQAPEPAQPPQMQSAPATPLQRQPQPEASPAAVTVDEDLEIFGIVKRICAESPHKATIQHKDAANFFVINLGTSRSWFIRLYAGKRTKRILVRLPLAQVETLAKGFQIEAEAEGVRVTFNTNADIEKLRPLILRAYEEAARGLKTEGAD